MKNQQTLSSVSERRKHPRIKIENDVSYILFNTNREAADQGNGKILNLSQSGTLLETEKPLNGPYVLLICLNMKGEKVKIKGRVANNRQSDKPDCYLTGIEFVGDKEEQLEAIVAFVKVYHHRRQSDLDKNLYSVKQSR